MRVGNRAEGEEGWKIAHYYKTENRLSVSSLRRPPDGNDQLGQDLLPRQVWRRQLRKQGGLRLDHRSAAR